MLFREKRKFASDGDDLISLTLICTTLREQINELEELQEKLSGESWQGILRYLAQKMIEKEHARSGVPVQEVIKHAMIQGQINQIKELTTDLQTIEKTLKTKQYELKYVSARVTKIMKRNEK